MYINICDNIITLRVQYVNMRIEAIPCWPPVDLPNLRTFSALPQCQETFSCCPNLFGWYVCTYVCYASFSPVKFFAYRLAAKLMLCCSPDINRTKREGSIDSSYFRSIENFKRARDK